MVQSLRATSVNTSCSGRAVSRSSSVKSQVSGLKPQVTSRGTRGRRASVTPRASADHGSIQHLIETTMDFGSVVEYIGSGSSGWASFSVATTTSGKKLFIKTSSRNEEMFVGEAAGLRALGHGGDLVIPTVHFAGATPDGCRDGNSVIIMDFLQFGARGDQAKFGTKLAAMHLSEPYSPNAKAGEFGFEVNNTCGDTPQPNEWCIDWVEFFIERRIKHQLKLANDATLSALGDKLVTKIPLYFTPFDESNPIKPSVLHGDLWSGNIGTVEGEPSVFDPAVYYGHNEAEFGMEWCAGFSESFYESYFSVFPKTEEYFAERRQLYRLYHYLNHYNLFGGGYKQQCIGIMKGLLGELRGSIDE